MECTYCAYIGNPEWGLAVRPSNKWVLICPVCRGIYTGKVNWVMEDYDETGSGETDREWEDVRTPCYG